MFTGNYVCRRCGEVFDTPHERTYREPREFWGMLCAEVFIEQTCPYCGSDDFEEEYVDEEDKEC